MIEITDRSKCNGCHACYSICPRSCIEMKADSEGFLYPRTDKERCVECGLCSKVCPIENGKSRSESGTVLGYAVMNNDEETRLKSSSGGVFTLIAKQIIKMIWCIGEEIKHNPKIREKLSVVFLEDYRVTLSEILMPAAEVSEQISLAGTEASGTGNMKLMLNGALTLGTYDGANVEIHEAVGTDNIFIFGMRTPEVNELRMKGYHPEDYINNSQVIRDVMARMYNGINGATFEEVANSIRNKDFYMALADFDSYRGTQHYISEVYRNQLEWNKKSLYNIAGAGRFSADRAVTDYARDIWNLK